MKYFYIFLLLFSYQISFAGIAHLLPKPQQISANKEKFYIKEARFSSPVLHQKWHEFFTEIGLKISEKSSQVIDIQLVSEIPNVSLNKEEAYTLSVSEKKIKITAITEKGVFWAMQTLSQLIVNQRNKSYFEGCEIVDFPAFRVRGFMQDVGRSYISLEELKREIAQLSRYKINVFHWHLTENQGWRLESKKYPILNQNESYERFHGKFYSFEEVRDLVQFCKNHGVMLIPEIDMPGHSLAFEKAFKCSMQSAEGMQILKELLAEMMPHFDVPYFHIGTDEVAFTNPNFVPEMVQFIRSFGKKVISWNPGWQYKEGEIDMTQLWSYRGKAQKGIPAIDCRLHYINHFDAFSDLIALYNSRILNVEKGDHDHAGSIVALWHDRLIENENDLIIQNNFYPAMLALAERSWLGGGSEYFDKFGTNLFSKDDEIYKNFADFERRMLYHKYLNFSHLPFAYVKQTDMQWLVCDPFPNDGDLTKKFPPETEKFSKKYIYNGKEYQTKSVFGAGIFLRHYWGNTVKTFLENPAPNHTAYAFTEVYSPENQEVGLWFSSQHYSRSEKDLPPPQGKWDYKESKLWINGTEILPPVWASSHTEKSNEIPLTNENFEVRKPLLVSLKKGWNKILVKLPVGKFSTSEVRLVKWHFNFAFVSPDGKKEVEGLKFRCEPQ